MIEVNEIRKSYTGSGALDGFSLRVFRDGQITEAFKAYHALAVAMADYPILDESGKPTVMSLGDYKLPTIRDVPPLRTVAVPAVPGSGPFGAKMIGELSNAGVAPAIANAVYNAVGARLLTMPLRAEDVFRALQHARSE